MGYPELSANLTAEELIQYRMVALSNKNYSLLYNSYHPQAPFIAQFQKVDNYLEFATQSLSDIELIDSHIGPSRDTAEGVEIICSLRFKLDSEMQTMHELALLLPTGDGWRYHSAQKLSVEDYQGEPESLNFSHFDQQSTKIRF